MGNITTLKIKFEMHFLFCKFPFCSPYLYSYLATSKTLQRRVELSANVCFLSCTKIYQVIEPPYAKDTDCSRAPAFWNVSRDWKKGQNRCYFLIPSCVIYSSIAIFDLRFAASFQCYAFKRDQFLYGFCCNHLSCLSKLFLNIWSSNIVCLG